MKKIISSILIYALLIQTGCYSEKWISTEDLKKAERNKIHVVAYDKNEYEGTSEDWFTKNDTLFINKPTQKIIPYDSIMRINISRYDSEKTIILITSIVFLGSIIYLLGASASHMNFHWE
jgi:hypothetical protein